MRTDIKILGIDLDTLLEPLGTLGMIWIPAAEAVQLQEDLNVRSLEDTCAAVERAGYEIHDADLPAKVSGLAVVIAGKPHIVLNRAKSAQNRQYTVPHELGHHVLHLNPSRNRDQPVLSSKDLAEFQAHIFAAMWVIRVANTNERQEVLRENPEASRILFSGLFMTFCLILVRVVAHHLSRLFRTWLPGAAREK